MRALVTGGAGFIGSHLVARLAGDGHEVRILDNFATGRRSNLLAFPEEVELIEGDIQSYERVHNAVAGCEVVFHIAALPSVPRSIQDPLTSHHTNSTGTLNVLLAARDAGVRRVVMASSSSVYGMNEALPKSEDMLPTPISPYVNVFGPRQDPRSQYAAVIPRFIAALLAGEAPTVFGDGQQSRDFTFVDNAVEANLRAMDAQGVAGEVFNIACGERTTINQLLGELRDLTDADIESVHVASRPGEVRHSQADCSRARKVLGYEPRIDLREGLGRTVDHFREANLPLREITPAR
jgi:nucleoside-diphosphate-sugar epimerase